MSDHGYIYVKGWKDFQHSDAIRSTSMPWIKLHVDLLGNDAWLELRPDDSKLLLTIWMLTARYGYGRVNASPSWLYRQANVGLSNRYRGIERLSEAGFIEVLASKAPRPRASTEGEGSKEPKKEKESARATGAAENGSIASHKKELDAALATARSWLEVDPPHLVEHTVRQAWPDMADEIVAKLNPAKKEAS